MLGPIAGSVKGIAPATPARARSSGSEMPRGGQACKRVGKLFTIERLDQKTVHGRLQSRRSDPHQRVRGEGEDRRLGPGCPASRPRIRLVVSMPSSCGIWMSIRTRS